jgi:hypothetical protein
MTILVTSCSIGVWFSQTDNSRLSFYEVRGYLGEWVPKQQKLRFITHECYSRILSWPV